MSYPLVVSDSIAGRARAVAPPFACSTSDGGHHAACVHVAGELDVATTPHLERALREARSQAPLVVLDLRELTFMDSSGVNAIVSRRCREWNNAKPRSGSRATPAAPDWPDHMRSIKQTFHRLREQRRMRRATLPWAELEAEAARQGCSAADILFTRVPGLPIFSDAGAARNPGSAPTPREARAGDQVEPTCGSWGRSV